MSRLTPAALAVPEAAVAVLAAVVPSASVEEGAAPLALVAAPLPSASSLETSPSALVRELAFGVATVSSSALEG